MKRLVQCSTAAIAGLVMGLMMTGQAAQASVFNQKEVDQSKFIALAVPLAGGRYKLMIVEQISNKRLCWQEGSAGVVDPLLTTFDFTGICGRNADSNGYSIRVANQDLWVNYQLALFPRDNYVELVGYPRGGTKKLPIGKTQSVVPGYLKINLDPGWRFTKRSYQGKTLGHVYLTRDSMPVVPIASPRPAPLTPPSTLTPPAGTTPPQPQPPSPSSQNAAAPLTQAVNIPVPPPSNAQPSRGNSQFTPAPQNNRPLVPRDPVLDSPPAPTVQSRLSQSSYRVVVPLPNANKTQALKALVPDAFRSTYRGQSVYQVGSFADQRKAKAMVQLLQLEGFRGIVEAR